MLKPIYIPIHSFVDVITNSSSEIFVAAEEKTAEAIKKLVTGLLQAGAGAHTADDLFAFDLVQNYSVSLLDEGSSKEMTLTKAEAESLRRQGAEVDAENDSAVTLRVTPKISTAQTIDIAKILSDLPGLYSITETYN